MGALTGISGNSGNSGLLVSGPQTLFTFTANGDLVVTGGPRDVQYFLIGGGGGGSGGLNGNWYGAAGASGVAISGTVAAVANGIYTVVIGTGGAGAFQAAGLAGSGGNTACVGLGLIAAGGNGADSASRVGASNA